MRYEQPDFLSLTYGEMTAVFCRRGASLRSLKFQGREMLLSPSGDATFLSDRDGYFGAVIFPFASRSKLPLSQKGKALPLIPNEGEVLNHGGSLSSAFERFDAKIKDGKVIFRLSVKKPVRYEIEVVYELTNDSLVVEIKAKAPGLEKAALAFHPYFNLGEGDALPLRLQLNALEVASYERETRLPLSFGAIPPVLDFGLPKTIGRDIEKTNFAGGYDHCYKVLSSPVCLLEGKEVEMRILSSFPCLQLYTLNEVPPCLGNKIKPHAGVAIEPMTFPLGIAIPRLDRFEGRVAFCFKRK